MSLLSNYAFQLFVAVKCFECCDTYLAGGYYQGPPVMAPPQYAVPPPKRQPGFLEGWYAKATLGLGFGFDFGFVLTEVGFCLVVVVAALLLCAAAVSLMSAAVTLPSYFLLDVNQSIAHSDSKASRFFGGDLFLVSSLNEDLIAV